MRLRRAAGAARRLEPPGNGERGSPLRSDKDWPNPYLTVSHYSAREPSAQKPSVRDLDVADSTPSLTHVLARSNSDVVFGQFHETKKMSQQARLEWPVAMDRQ
jgi:hypothetical protein